MADLTLEQRRAIAVAEAKVAMGRERVPTPPAREPSFIDRYGRSMATAAACSASALALNSNSCSWVMGVCFFCTLDMQLPY